MTRKINRLSARTVETQNKPGRHADGNGLYLSISENGGRRWVFLYRRNGRLREMGLGSARVVTLADARKKALAARATLANGIDPLVAREQKSGLTLKDCAERYIEDQKSGWKNAKHAGQWSRTLEAYVYPHIGSVPVAEIDTSSVMRCLHPIWRTKNETASRVRNRVERVLDWARVNNYRSGENPARWRGHLDKVLPKRTAVHKVEHFPALPFAELPDFIKRLRARRGVAALALEFTILTAARTGQTLNARWHEIDFKQCTWFIQGPRMKNGESHRVPLSGRALAILQELRDYVKGDLVFPHESSGRPLSYNAMREVLQRMGFGHVTPHGFRSTFKDWAAETTDYSGDLSEMALAHKIKNATEAAYRRMDLLDKRRQLMEDWATFCGGDKP